jgi:hypothetical protein
VLDGLDQATPIRPPASMTFIDGLSKRRVLFPAFSIQPKVEAAFDGVLHCSASLSMPVRVMLFPATLGKGTNEMPPAINAYSIAVPPH